jgi:hypothetical protein
LPCLIIQVSGFPLGAETRLEILSKRRYLIVRFCGQREARNLKRSYEFPVTLAEGSHPFPSRTRKLSPPAPMVLRWQRRGRVGRRRIKNQKPRKNLGAFLSSEQFLIRLHLPLPPSPPATADKSAHPMTREKAIRRTSHDPPQLATGNWRLHFPIHISLAFCISGLIKFLEEEVRVKL